MFLFSFHFLVVFPLNFFIIKLISGFLTEVGMISAPEGSIITEDGSLVSAEGVILAPLSLKINR